MFSNPEHKRKTMTINIIRQIEIAVEAHLIPGTPATQ